MQFPIWEPRGDDLREFVVQIDSLGFDSVWLGDHVVLPGTTNSSYPYQWRFDDSVKELFPNKNFLEALALTGFIAGVSPRLEIGLGVLVLPIRNAVVLAKELATLDQVSGGRVIVGTGAGWLGEEFDAVGVKFSERGPRYEETIAVLKSLWGPQPASFSGRFYDFKDMHCEPLPATPSGPPLWVGGHSAVALRRCADFGTGWHAVELSPQEFARHNRRLDELLRERGRRPSEVVRTLGRRFHLGSADEVRAAVSLFDEYRELGCGHIVAFATPSRSVRENIDRAARLAEALQLT
jgi:probable F420-dependent oxidoreductase